MQCAHCYAEVPEDSTKCPGCEADVGWRVRRWDGVTYGPFDERSLKLFSREGRIALSDYCQQGPAGAWIPIQQVVGALPPPAPGAPEASTQAAEPSGRGRKFWVIGCIAVVALGLAACVFVVVSAFRQTHAGTAQQHGARCEGNLAALGAALSNYRLDHDDRFPPGTDWGEPLRPYMSDPMVLYCPASSMAEYEFNGKLGGVAAQDVFDATRCVAAYDGPLTQGGSARHPGGNGALYVDGTASMIPQGASSTFTLDPKQQP